MPSDNKIIIAAAGGGKTTRIVRGVLAKENERAAVVTYTNNNTEQIEQKLYELNASMPAHVEVYPWFTFLLREMARPYQNFLYERHIDGINWVEGRSDQYAPQWNIPRFYFANGARIYSDKISQFICACDQASGGKVMQRLKQRYDHIYIDEVQDMAGYDLDLLHLMLETGPKLTLVGDHRQATFKTNNGLKNKAYGGNAIIKKFREWEKAGLSTLTYEAETHRCNQKIADFADTIFPTEPKTKSLNTTVTGHDGLFLISAHEVANYVEKYQPQILRLDTRTKCPPYTAMNFGESKGLTFERVLIFPHKKGQDWLKSGDYKHIEGVASKLYVAATRARYSLTFVFHGATKLPGF